MNWGQNYYAYLRNTRMGIGMMVTGISGDVYDGESGQKIAHISYNRMVKFNGKFIKNDRS